MKRVFFGGIVALIASVCFSCSKDSDYQQPDIPEDKSEYYVKYEAQFQYNSNHSLSVKTESGDKILTTTTSKKISEIFGPIPKGFFAYASTYEPASIMIYVSKDNGPFALKASGEKSASYTINF